MEEEGEKSQIERERMKNREGMKNNKNSEGCIIARVSKSNLKQQSNLHTRNTRTATQACRRQKEPHAPMEQHSHLHTGNDTHRWSKQSLATRSKPRTA
ncbi:uncharacterized protein G2W53_026195 [Senna tora]|uniref:Uncharacterized protein n=1 Tax=Senna tora TaxID=362788 RepID=A0A834TF89_9FABA|nr:uncharacterized protein G2W53_026195 [Senna tora]